MNGETKAQANSDSRATNGIAYLTRVEDIEDALCARLVCVWTDMHHVVHRLLLLRSTTNVFKILGQCQCLRDSAQVERRLVKDGSRRISGNDVDADDIDASRQQPVDLERERGRAIC